MEVNRGVLLLVAVSCATSLRASSIVISTRQSTTLFGSGLEYSLNTNGNGDVQKLSLTGNPVSLSNAGAALTIDSYATSWGSYSYLTGASLTFTGLAAAPSFNLDRVTGSPAISTPFFTPTLSGSLGNITINIQSGNITRTVTVAAANLSSFSYDLFNNGFANQLQSGAAFNITFDVQDTITADTSGYFHTVKNQTETLFFSESRLIDGVDFDVVYDEVPEPLPTMLIAGGLLVLVGIGVRRSGKS
jgi:hypothetical protein